MTDPTEKSYLGGRLQRPAARSTQAIFYTRQVIQRHLLTMSVITVAAFVLLGSTEALRAWLTPLTMHWVGYGLATLLILGLMLAFLRFRRVPISQMQWGWLAYLLLISTVEEFAFRVFVPLFLDQFFDLRASVIISSVIFGALHYWTLRWRLGACVFTVFGGLGFSRLLHTTDDLALVVLVHWLVTFLNTPRPPRGQTASKA
jgi:membrane protease YdiL (CAAX protease family)